MEQERFVKIGKDEIGRQRKSTAVIYKNNFLMVLTYLLFSVCTLFCLTCDDPRHLPDSEDNDHDLESAAKAPWLSRITQNIKAEQYRITGQDGDFRATNPAQKLSVTFDASGPTVFAFGEQGAWHFSMVLDRVGRHGLLTHPQEPIRRLGQCDEKLSRGVTGECLPVMVYDHGGMAQWYANRVDGLKQAFELLASPQGGGLVEIRITPGGDLSGRMDLGGDQLIFSHEGRDVLTYNALAVFDATGRELSSWLDFDGDIRIFIDDENAVYPVFVDPILSAAPSWVKESDRTSAQFGISVAGNCDVNNDTFSDVIIGAYKYSNGQLEEGRVFVFQGDSLGLPDSASWSAESNQSNAHFGISVACAGDVNNDTFDDVVVGAHEYDNGQPEEGVVFGYYGSETGLSHSADWIMQVNQGDANFGISVSGAGDFNGDGYDDVIIGAPYFEDGVLNEGAAFMYLGSATGLTTFSDWMISGENDYAHFGSSVAGAGDINQDGFDDVVIGAYTFHDGEDEEGLVYVVFGGEDEIELLDKWSYVSGQANAHLGQCVSGAGDVNGDGFADIAAGAPGYDGSLHNEGRVMVFHGSETGLPSAPDWEFGSDQSDSDFGMAIAGVGDLDVDGFSDLLIGAPKYTNGHLQEGRAMLFAGSAFGLESTQAWMTESNQITADFGISVAGAGDVNGDGHKDVIIGANLYDNGQLDEGRAYVYYGGPQNYDCSSARHISKFTTYVDSTTSSATGDYTPWCTPGDSAPDVVFSFNGQYGNKYIIDILGEFHTTIYVRCGDCETGTPIDCNHNYEGSDLRGHIDFLIPANQACFIFVDGYESGEGGQYSMEVQEIKGCRIDGAWYADGETDPTNGCMVCSHDENPMDWSFNDGALCDDGVFCNGLDYCSSGSCDSHGEPACGDDLLYCTGNEGCDEENDECYSTGNPCTDDGLFCNGGVICNENSDTCADTNPPCPNDGIWCNGIELCDDVEDVCYVTDPPCPNDNLFCTGIETCDESEQNCYQSGDPCSSDGLWCNGDEYCDEGADACLHTTTPQLRCPDNGAFCDGEEQCNDFTDQCVSTGDPCSDDGVWCNGVESCDEGLDACVHSSTPELTCPDDGDFCTGAESCDEQNETCVSSGDPCTDDGAFCNGAESCNEQNDQCQSAGNPCPDDGVWCNGEESCDEQGDVCLQSNPPCPDDFLFCNGAEQCNETQQSCDHTGDPCGDDGLYCNGDESCDENDDQCIHSGDPCSDDDAFCNGDEFCDESDDQCAHTGNPCSDDGVFCNGTEQCDEGANACSSTGDPCGDDGLYCNGSESCDESASQCAHSGDPCFDDGVFCNGQEQCRESNDTCGHAGNPCPDDGQ